MNFLNQIKSDCLKISKQKFKTCRGSLVVKCYCNLIVFVAFRIIVFRIIDSNNGVIVVFFILSGKNKLWSIYIDCRTISITKD